MVTCPTGSIRLEKPDPLVANVIDNGFPLAIDTKRIPTVFHLGYHSRHSYGAIPYLIVRKRGNVMVDCPRYSKTLADHIDAVGVLSIIFLTHKDDVCDHAKWKVRVVVAVEDSALMLCPLTFYSYFLVHDNNLGNRIIFWALMMLRNVFLTR